MTSMCLLFYSNSFAWCASIVSVVIFFLMQSLFPPLSSHFTCGARKARIFWKIVLCTQKPPSEAHGACLNMRFRKAALACKPIHRQTSRQTQELISSLKFFLKQIVGDGGSGGERTGAWGRGHKQDICWLSVSSVWHFTPINSDILCFIVFLFSSYLWMSFS